MVLTQVRGNTGTVSGARDRSGHWSAGFRLPGIEVMSFGKERRVRMMASGCGCGCSCSADLQQALGQFSAGYVAQEHYS